ncbi:TIGR00730 family Rossman fold protein [Rhodobacteraceae bacterium 2CG4]|uniref:Cytokinin riboside 5'-monophosphate phosphoribohydrolase n=1 Tax=Halovulum marinum TaxID=2662447 RepID=A0A6L5YXK3_9RHOB|nr:TIGR00730 family Rossman fold protein [Halovulum marinum]MSU88967.1 TIGR00730 family Rossman fold protein [Halovulum marinum]
MSQQPRLSVCVYCGSRDGSDPAFAAAAEAVGALLAENGFRLVYGAGDVGLMGRVARTAQAGGAETLGVIPAHLMAREAGKADLTTLIVTETMHERKKVMFMNADAVVALPGGAGTLDELFEVLTWRQLGLHEKPLFLLNTAGYWGPLITMIAHLVDRGFADRSFLEFLRVVDSPDQLRAALRSLS